MHCVSRVSDASLQIPITQKFPLQSRPDALHTQSGTEATEAVNVNYGNDLLECSVESAFEGRSSKREAVPECELGMPVSECKIERSNYLEFE